MSRLTEAEFTDGVQLLYGNVEFSVDPTRTRPALRNDGGGGNALGALPGASASFADDPKNSGHLVTSEQALRAAFGRQ